MTLHQYRFLYTALNNVSDIIVLQHATANVSAMDDVNNIVYEKSASGNIERVHESFSMSQNAHPSIIQITILFHAIKLSSVKVQYT